MAQTALEPTNHQRHDIEWFAKNGIQQGLCEVCLKPMIRKGRYSEDVAEHFAHATKGSGCPTIQENRKKYADLPPSGYDPANATIIKQAVKDNLLSVFYKARSLTDDAMSVKLFQELIQVANQKRAWEFVGLRLEFVPYLLVSLYDGMYETKRYNKTKREFVKTKFFMALEPGVRHLDDLWNKPTQIKQKIWRVFPSQQLIEELPIDDQALTEPHWFGKVRTKVADLLGV